MEYRKAIRAHFYLIFHLFANKPTVTKVEPSKLVMKGMNG